LRISLHPFQQNSVCKTFGVLDLTYATMHASKNFIQVKLEWILLY
jgi:hypothetical protein